MPAIAQDLSVAVDADDHVEELGDRIRDALEEQADAIEEVTIRSEIAYDRLPGSAIERIGMTAGQKNVLVRVVLRHVERTLTDLEANQLRDRIYAAIHQGARHEWATKT